MGMPLGIPDIYACRKCSGYGVLRARNGHGVSSESKANEGLRDLCENCKEANAKGVAHESPYNCLFDPEGSGNMCGCSVCGNDTYKPNEYQIMQRQFGSDGGHEISDLQYESKASESLDPNTTDISQCVVCGRSSNDHSNPNTDYRGNTGTAPPTDHYFEGGNLGGSDDKPYFTNKRGGFAGYDSSDSPDDVYINAGKTGKIWGKKFESKASEYQLGQDMGEYELAKRYWDGEWEGFGDSGDEIGSMATRGAKIISDSEKEQILRNSKDVQEYGIQYATSTSWDDLSEEDMIAIIQSRPSLGESKASELFPNPSSEGFVSPKTFTCEFCGKVGTDFVEMAKEICPENGGAGHQIPIFGDMEAPKDYGEPESLANELFGQNDPDEILGGSFGTPENTMNDVYNMTSHNYSDADWDKYEKLILNAVGKVKNASNFMGFTHESIDSFLRRNGATSEDLIYDLTMEYGTSGGQAIESKANEFGDPLIGSWDEGGWFFGITNMTRDDYEGGVYWKGVKVEHYDHDYFGHNDDNNNWVDEMRQDAKELERKILELEAKNIPVNMSSVLASYESKANEGMAECPHCDGEGKIDVDWTGSGIAQCPACNGSGKMDKKLADDYIQNDMDQTSRARSNMYGDDEYIDGSDVPTSGFYESKANVTCPNCGNTKAPYLIDDEFCDKCYVEPPESKWQKYDRWTSYGVSDEDARGDIFNEVDNSMDLGLLSGGIPEVNATNNEQCEICGQLIDQDLMDYHVEQEHGLHVPSQYTQDTISQSMGDPNYDHLEDWRTSYGESKKIANEGSFNDAMDMLMWVNYDSDEEMYEAVAEYTGMDYEKVKKRMEAEQRALDTESKAKEISSKIEDMKYDEEPMRFGDGHGILEDPLYPESEKSNEYDPNDPESMIDYRSNKSEGGQLCPNCGSDDTYLKKETSSPMQNTYGSGIAGPLLKDWIHQCRNCGHWFQSLGESEGEDEPEYYDDIPEEKFPTDFELEDVKEEDVVVENRKLIHSSPTGNVWEDENGELSDDNGNYIPDHDPDFEPSEVSYAEDWEQQREEDNWKKEEITESKSKAEEAFNRGASAEEIYTLVDTKESEDGRTQSEDDYLNNLYNKTTANRSAGFTDL